MMISEEFSQAAELIKKANNILLIPHAKMDCDGMSAALSLYLLLKKLNKNPSAICTDPVPEAFSFLPSTDVFSEEIPASFGGEQAFMMTLNTADKPFKDLRYEVKDGKVNILFFSEGNPFEEKDFSFIGNSFRPDLIITLDSGDTHQLGKIYSDNNELFEKTPVINIDHHISNTQFGDVNLVDFKACSTTEIIYSLIPSLGEFSEDLIDENIATLLLAGMLTDTGSFQHANTTPRSLDIAAVLIEKGARHQEIIKNLFKTKNLSTLRLWGRLLTKLQNDPIYRMIWSSVSAIDLEETQSKSEDADGLIDELLSTTPGTELVLLIKEREDGVISTSVRSVSPLIDSVAFALQFGGGGHKQAAGFKIRDWGGKSFDEIVSDIVFEAKKFQAERLGVRIPTQNIKEIIANSSTPLPTVSPEPQIIIPETPQMPTFPHNEEAGNTDKNEEEEEEEIIDDGYRPDPIFPDKTLTEDESKLLGKENFGMPEPEKVIQKPAFEGFEKPKVQIDDFADFISQVQDNAKTEVFIPKITDTNTVVTNILENHHSDLHREDEMLASLHHAQSSTQEPISSQNTTPPITEDPFLAALKL